MGALEMTKRDEAEFRQYLRQCTNAQVRGVYEKERNAGRADYAWLAQQEAAQRGIEL
jgi:hypothetical protein